MKEESQAIFEHAEMNQRLEHLNRVLKAIRNVNQLIMAEDDPQRLTERACASLTETMGYHNAWIALLGGEAARRLGLPEARPVAAVAATGFDDGFEILLGRLERGRFPDCMARTLASDETLVKSNTAVDCLYCPLHNQCQGRAILARRLEFEDVTWGVLTASVPAAYARDAEEQDLFNEVAGDLAFALHRTAAAREQEENRRYMAFVIEGSGVGTWEWNVQTNETRFNDQWATMLGYTIEEMTPYDYTTWERLVHPEDLEQTRKTLVDCVEGRTTCYDCEFRIRHKDGRWVWILDRGRVMNRDDAGQPLFMFGTHTDITEQKRLQNQSIEAHSFLETVLDQSPFPMWIGDANGTLIRTNQALREALNLTDEQLVGRYNPLQDPNVIREDLTETIRAVIEQHKPARFTMLWRPMEFGGEGYKSGQDRYVDLAMYPIVRDGQLQNIVTQWQDITERVQAEEALRESEQRLQAVFSAVKGVPIQGYDKDRRVILWNPASELLYGYSHDEAIGRVLEELIIPEESRQAVVEGIIQWHEQGVPIPSGEIELQNKNGERVQVYSNHVMITNHSGEKEMFCIDVDLTQRKRAEEEVRESNRRFAIAFKYSPAPLVLSEIDTGLFLDVNDRWIEMLEFTREEQIGRTSKEVGIWDEPGERDRIVQLLRSEGRFRDEPIRFKTKSGNMILALWSAETVDLSGKQAMLSMITDITQLKQAEEERERLGAQLQQAQRMEAVGRLAGGVAHDFNNMLNVILGHIEFMSEDLPTDSPQREDLDEIRNAAERSADLTRQLLAFARKQTVAPKNLDLNETVASMLKMLQRLIGEDVDMLWKPSASLDMVRIDPGQVDQMLANLVVNARDAIGQAHGKVTIETRNARFDEAYCADHAGFIPGDYVMLAVSDDGCGMDGETRSNIFEPFFTTKGIGKGTGLGLATVYGIVKQNEGFVNVYSEPGQGTTFRIYFPALAEVLARSTGVGDGPDSPDTGDETILVAEDQPALLSLTRTMLERLGYTVLTARTPGEAIQLAEEHASEIHLLVTDVVMPEMNGRDLAKNILSIYPNLKCLFMSGYTANVIAHHGVLDEGVSFIQKPFSRAQFAAKVRKTLGSVGA